MPFSSNANKIPYSNVTILKAILAFLILGFPVWFFLKFASKYPLTDTNDNNRIPWLIPLISYLTICVLRLLKCLIFRNRLMSQWMSAFIVPFPYALGALGVFLISNACLGLQTEQVVHYEIIQVSHRNGEFNLVKEGNNPPQKGAWPTTEIGQQIQAGLFGVGDSLDIVVASGFFNHPWQKSVALSHRK